MKPKKNKPDESEFNITRQYCNEIGLVSLLKSHEERSLADSIEAGYQRIFHYLCTVNANPDGLTILRKEYNKREISQDSLDSLDSFENRLRSKPSPQTRQEYFNFCYRELSQREPIRNAGKNLYSQLNGNHDKIKKDLQQTEQQIVVNREYFILANRRLVAKLAKGYQDLGLSYMDLNQEGTLGLMEAVDRFDQTRGFKFSTYASWWIKQAMSRAIKDKVRTIRLPVHIIEFMRTIYRAEQELYQELQRDPTDSELAQKLNKKEEKIKKFRRFSDAISFSTSIGEDDFELEDLLAGNVHTPETIVSWQEKKEILMKELQKLSPREELILRRRFGVSSHSDDYDDDHILVEIGTELGLTRERIRQIESHALRKLHTRNNLRELLSQP